MTSGGTFWKKDNQDSNQPTRNFFKSPWICINRSKKYMCVLFKLIYVHAAAAKSVLEWGAIINTYTDFYILPWWLRR